MKKNLSTLHHHRTRQVRVIILILGLISISTFAITLPATHAQTPSPAAAFDISLNAAAAFEGNFKYGEWVPVFVEIDNRGPDINAEVRIPIQGAGGTMVYTSPVELPAGARKRIATYVLPNNFTRQLSVELVSGEDLLASQRISVSPNPTVNFLVGLVGPERSALSMIAAVELPGMKRPVVLVDLPLDEIPERYEGLRSFDLIVLSDIDTSKLTPLQGSTLETWVRQGGRLVAGGGPAADLVVAGLPESLFTAEIVSTQEITDLTALESFIGQERPVLVPGPFIAAVLKTDTGRTLATQNGLDLVHEWTIAKGTLDFIALNPIVSPFDAWNGTTAFWDTLISPGAAFSEYLPTDISARQQFSSNMPYVLSNLPVLDMPSAKSLALMLVLYILLVGPVNYFVLHRRKSLHLAWITIPLITIFFSAASFGLGYALHGTDIFINKISILQVSPSGAAHFDSFVGVFSPAQTAYQIEVKGGGLLSPLNPYNEPWSSMSPPSTSASSSRVMSLVQGDPAFIKGLSVDQWSMQSFMSEGDIPGFGTLAADLQIDQDRLSGRITNPTNHTFHDSFVVIGNKFVALGQLAPGQAVDLELDLANLGAPNFSTSLSYSLFEKDLNSAGPSTERRQAEARRSIIESIFERTPPYISSSKAISSGSSSSPVPTFIGWIETAPPDVSIVGVEPGRQTTALAVIPLAFQLAGDSSVTLPVGLIPGTLTVNPREGGTCGMPGTTAVYITRGEAKFEFTLPQQVDSIQVQNLKLALWTDSGVFAIPKIQLLDWSKEEWISLSGINQGVNLIPDAAKFVRSDGVIQIQVGAENAQSCYYLGLGLEGTRP